MPDDGRIGGPVVDALLSLAVTGYAIAVFADSGQLGRPATWLLVVSLLALGACSVAVPQHPYRASLVACAVLGVAALPAQSRAADTASAGALAIVFLLLYRIGTTVEAWHALALATVAVLVLQLANPPFNPIFPVVTLGPVLVGAAVRARAEALALLEARGRELAHEQQRQAQEAVRYERARIARELHDVVAHSVTVMVVLAGAGQVLSRRDPVAAGQALDEIAEQAERAGEEVTRLFALLDPPDQRAAGGLDDLVRGATVAGLDVRPVAAQACGLSARAGAAAFELVREALTNAIKHAPGSTVEITFDTGPGGLEVVVTNGPARLGDPGLTAAGGGHGMVGMLERLQGWDGRLTSGPTADGGWEVRAQLPEAG